jgi:hypothetical protein
VRKHPWNAGQQLIALCQYSAHCSQLGVQTGLHFQPESAQAPCDEPNIRHSLRRLTAQHVVRQALLYSCNQSCADGSQAGRAQLCSCLEPYPGANSTILATSEPGSKSFSSTKRTATSAGGIVKTCSVGHASQSGQRAQERKTRCGAFMGGLTVKLNTPSKSTACREKAHAVYMHVAWRGASAWQACQRSRQCCQHCLLTALGCVSVPPTQQEHSQCSCCCVALCPNCVTAVCLLSQCPLHDLASLTDSQHSKRHPMRANSC